MEALVCCLRLAGRVVLVCGLVCGLDCGFALDCVSAAAGNWNAASTWSSCGGGVPGVGDTATITHTVDVTDARSVGTDPANETTFVIQVNTGGHLRIQSGGVLTVRGNFQLSNAPLTVFGGGELRFDGTVASQTYVGRISTANNNANAKLNLSGTSFTNQAIIRTVAGSPRGRLARGSGVTSGGGMVNCEYSRIIDLGSASLDAIDANILGSNISVVWNYCSVENSGFVSFGTSSLSQAGVFDVQNSRIVDSLASGQSFQFQCRATDDFTTGRCIFRGNYIEGGVSITITARMTFERNIVRASAGGTFTQTLNAGTSTTPWTSFENNVLINRASSAGGRGGNGNQRYNLFITEANNANPHFMGVANGGNWIREFNILDPSLRLSTAGDSGDGFYHASTTASQTVRYNVITAGHKPVVGLAMGGSSSGPTAVFTGHNNTFPLTGIAAARSGEGYTGHANMVRWHSNSLYHHTITGSSATFKANHITSTDNVYEECDFNGAGEFTAGSLGNGYNMTRTNGPCGTNDLNEDPKLVSEGKWRNAGRYYAWVTNTPYVAGDGAGSSWEGLVNEWRKRNTPDWNAAFEPEAIHNWIWQGYAPLNLKYATRGKDGSQIGAVRPRILIGAL